MTTKQAMKILESRQIKTFSLKELKELGKPIMSTVRKRVRNIEKKNMEYSPAYQSYIVNKGMKASVAGTNLNKIRNELYEALSFLNAKTSTIKGIIDFDKNASKIFTDWRDISAHERGVVWSAFGIIQNESPQLIMKYGYQEVLQKIADQLKYTGNEDIRELVEETMRSYGYVRKGTTWVSEDTDNEAYDVWG